MTEIDEEFLKFCMISAESYGFDDLTAKIFAILYLEPKELSLEELANRTGYSLASISNKMKILEPLSIVKRIKKPGSKKLYFYMEKDVVELTKFAFERAHKSEIVPAKEIIPGIIEKYKNKKLSKVEEEKLNIIIKYYQQMLLVEDLFNEFRERLNDLR